MTKISKTLQQEILKELREACETSIDAILTNAPLTPVQKREAKEVFFGTKTWKQQGAVIGRLTTEEVNNARSKFAKQAGPMLRKILGEASKQLPHLTGGRSKSLTDEQRIKVCRDIGTLMGNGAQLKDAVKRVAQSFGVSTRTIYRAWQGRANYKK